MRLPGKFLLSGVAVALVTACASSEQASVETQQPRAILVSIDALNEQILRDTLSSAEAPALFRVFEQGACTEYAQPNFPAVTASGHASLWTGATSRTNNITANAAHRLPRDQYRATDTVSGFSSENLSAEPIWITAGHEQLRVAAHHATQGPGEAGFLPRTGARDNAAEEARARVNQGYEQAHVQVMNGYNIQVAGNAALTSDDVEWVAADQWPGVQELATAVEPKGFRFSNDAGTFYGVLFGAETYQQVAVGPEPDVAAMVHAQATPAETEAYADRELARYFSEPLRIPTEAGDTFLRIRLFEVNADGSDFLLYHPAMHVMDTNHDAVTEAYNEAVQGWFGNSSTRLYTGGAFGTPIFAGGDGTAEQRYLETAELATRVFNKGSQFFWEQEPSLMIDYFPLGDAIDHSLFTYFDPAYPEYEQETAAAMLELRNQTWQLVDLRLNHLLELAAADDAAVFVAGDHGMRGSWLEFRPNVLLQEAGLQHLDEDGNIDLSRSQAVAPTGHWVTVNTTEWQDGIVDPADKADVLAEIQEAFAAATGPDGEPIIERLYLPAEHPELGLGGAAGGDLYWAEAQGYRSSRLARAEHYAAETSPLGWHSVAATDPAMRTVTCAYGSDFPAARIPAATLRDVAPTVAEYLGIPAPQHSEGESLLPWLRQQP